MECHGTDVIDWNVSLQRRGTSVSETKLMHIVWTGRGAHPAEAVRSVLACMYAQIPIGKHMKSTPNDSTSPAKKSKMLRRIRRWAATELRFGLVQVLTYVRTCLTPIFEISIF